MPMFGEWFAVDAGGLETNAIVGQVPNRCADVSIATCISAIVLLCRQPAGSCDKKPCPSSARNAKLDDPPQTTGPTAACCSYINRKSYTIKRLAYSGIPDEARFLTCTLLAMCGGFYNRRYPSCYPPACLYKSPNRGQALISALHRTEKLNTQNGPPSAWEGGGGGYG